MYSDLLDINKEFLVFLKQGILTEERDKYIGMINEFLDKREKLINNVKESKAIYSTVEAAEIIQINKEINALLASYFNNIKNDIKRIHQSKEKNKKYSNPYEIENLDGTFLDKRS